MNFKGIRTGEKDIEFQIGLILSVRVRLSHNLDLTC